MYNEINPPCSRLREFLLRMPTPVELCLQSTGSGHNERCLNSPSHIPAMAKASHRKPIQTIQRLSRDLGQSLRPFESHIPAGHRSVTEPREGGDWPPRRCLRSRSSTTPSPPHSRLFQPSPSLSMVFHGAFSAFLPQ